MSHPYPGTRQTLPAPGRVTAGPGRDRSADPHGFDVFVHDSFNLPTEQIKAAARHAPIIAAIALPKTLITTK